jgi:hypothetical protein
MSSLTCNQAEELLDLYAADECDPQTAAAVERHLADCPACATAHRESRRVLALLDLHAQAPAGLARLNKRIDQEDRRLRQPRRALPFVGLLTAAAALVLFTFGLTGGGMEQPETIATALVADARTLQAMKATVGVPDREPGGVAEAARFDHDVKLPADMTLTVVLDRDGMNADEYRRYLREARRTATLPLPPALNLSLELRNASSAEKFLYFEDERTKLSLDLQGAGVLRLNAPGDVAAPVPTKTIRVDPGQSLPLPVRHLIDGSRRKVQYLYWIEPGEYTLTIRLRVPASEQAPNSPHPTVPLTDLDCTTYVSRPVRIKVVEKR